MDNFFAPVKINEISPDYLLYKIDIKNNNFYKKNNINDSRWTSTSITGGNIELRNKLFAEIQNYCEEQWDIKPYPADFHFINEYIDENKKKSARVLSFIEESAQSITLGILLKAAESILKLKLKNDWDIICVTGKISYNGKTINLYPIDDLSEKYESGFLKIADGNLKKSLFLYIGDEEDIALLPDGENLGKNSNITRKSFSPDNNLFFDILDFLFYLPAFPEGSFDNEQKTSILKNENIIKRYFYDDYYIDSKYYHNNFFCDILKEKSLLIYGNTGSGKSFLASYIARRLFWENIFYSFIWINFEISYDYDENNSFNEKKIENYFNKLLSDINDIYSSLSNKPYLVIIDNFNINNRLFLTDYYYQTMSFINTINNYGSRVIFLSNTIYDIPSLAVFKIEPFDKKSIISYFHNISKYKKYYNKKIKQMESDILTEYNCNALEHLHDVIFNNYKSSPNMIRLISNELFLKPATDYKKLFISIENRNKGIYIDESVKIIKNNYNNLSEDAKTILIYILNFNPNRTIPFSNLDNHYRNAKYKDSELINLLENILNNEEKTENVKNELVLAGFLYGVYPDFYISFNIYKLLLSDNNLIPKEKIDRILSKKIMISECLLKYSEDEYDDEQLQIFKYKLDYIGENIRNIIYNKKSNIIHICAGYCPNTVFLETLINKYPDLFYYKSGDELKPVANEDDFTALHYAALNNKNPDIIEYLLNTATKHNINGYLYYETKHIPDENSNQSGSCLPLHLAAQKNNIMAVETLVYNDLLIEKTINQQDSKGFTPLIHALLFNNNIEIADFLLKGFINKEGIKAKSSINIPNIEKHGGNILIFCFAQSPNISIADKKYKLLTKYLNKETINEYMSLEDNYGVTALHYAAGGLQDTVLLKKIFNINNINKKNSKGSAPFHYAIEYNTNLEAVKSLIDIGADINLPNGYGDTPIHIALRKKYYDTVLFLLSKQADLNCQNEKGYTPLHFSIFYRISPELTNKIITRENVNLQSNNGDTPLHILFRKEKDKEIDINDLKKILNKLLEYGADANIANENQAIPLHIAISNKIDCEIIKILISKTINIDSMDKRGMTPLHYAAYFGYYEAAVLLKEHGADLNALTNNKYAPFHMAIQQGFALDFFDLLATQENLLIETENENIDFSSAFVLMDTKKYKNSEIKKFLKKFVAMAKKENKLTWHELLSADAIKEFFTLIHNLIKNLLKKKK